MASGGDIGGHKDASEGNEGDRKSTRASTYAHRYASENT
jgi:hypothetical protein